MVMVTTQLIHGYVHTQKSLVRDLRHMIEQIGDKDGMCDKGAATTVHMELHGTAPVFDSTQGEWTEYVTKPILECQK